MIKAGVLWLNKIRLTKFCGDISKHTLDRYLNLPGAPPPNNAKMYDAEAVKSFIVANSNRIGNKDKLEAARLKKLGLESERIAFALSVDKRDYVPTSVVAPAFAKLWGELHGMFRQKFEFELPSKYVGKNAIECAQINIEALSLIDKRFREAQPL